MRSEDISKTKPPETQEDFDTWAFRQCVVKGHKIQGVKNEHGVNIKYINTTTLEEFELT
jgi:hypothetical protein